MEKIKTCLTILLAVVSIAIGNAQQNVNTILNDVSSLIGKWQGSLTYLDYTSAKPYTMPANVEIGRLEGTNMFTFIHTYPNETSANSVDTLTISPDEQFIDKGLLKSRNVLANGDIEIVTEEKGTDGNDNKQAIFRHTYLIGESHFSNTKEVQFEGETKWIKRHEYTYTRNTPKNIR